MAPPENGSARLVCWGFQDNKPLVYKTIHEAAKNGDLADVINHLARGTDVNVKDNYGETPLHWAISYGHKDVAELLIAKGANVNTKGQGGETPLHMAAIREKGNKDVAELLIAKGADVNAKDERGMTPLDAAAIAGSKDVAELLIAKGANVKTASADGGTPLHTAASFGQKDMAELLITKGADVNAKLKDGRTPLFLADALDMAELLIAKGADVNARDSDGNTPLSTAASASHTDMVELLKKHGARENQPSGSLPSHPPELPSTLPTAPIRITGELAPPKIIKRVDPEYPEIARQARVQGVVIIEATTDVQGKVNNARIIRPVWPYLDEAALAAVKQWIFEPWIIDGMPHGVIFMVTVKFSLNIKKLPLL